MMKLTPLHPAICFAQTHSLVVLFVTSVYDNPVSGPATYARLLHAAFSNASFAFITITSDAAQADQRMICVEKTKTPSDIYKRLWKTAKMAVELLPGKKVIVHFNNAFPYLFFGRLGTKSFIQLNDYMNIEVPYYLRGRYTWKVKLHHIARKATEHISVKRTDKLICNSHYTFDKAIEHYRIPKEKCVLIYKSMRLEEMQLRPPIQPSGSILYVGNDLYRKGFDILASALGRCKKVTTLHIAGPSFKTDKEHEFLRMIPKHIKVIQHGSVPSEQLYHIMAQTDLVVIPARFEALGVSIIEALAQGVPVLTSGVGGLKEVLKGYPAVFSDYDNLNSEQLARNLDLVFTGYSDYLEQVSSKINHMRKLFSPVTMTQQLTELYYSET